MEVRIPYKIRRYSSDDARVLRQLFESTIENVNCSDYSEEEIRAWIDRSHFDPKKWAASLQDRCPWDRGNPQRAEGLFLDSPKSTTQGISIASIATMNFRARDRLCANETSDSPCP